jgi:hypothetical protein
MVMSTEAQIPDQIPEKFESPAFHFEVLEPKHVKLDYQALMSSRDYLRRWSNSSWLEDNFSIADNLNDLEWHFEEYKGKFAFTYTILNDSGDKCLGCIYIRPTESIRNLKSEEREILAFSPYFCSYWVIDEIRQKKLSQDIFSAINNWIKKDWMVSNMLYTCNLEIPEQATVFQNNGFEILLQLQIPHRYQIFWVEK